MTSKDAAATSMRTPAPAVSRTAGDYSVKVVGATQHPNDARRIADAVELLVKMRTPAQRQRVKKAA